MIETGGVRLDNGSTDLVGTIRFEEGVIRDCGITLDEGGCRW
jgi:hypothetical protein